MRERPFVPAVLLNGPHFRMDFFIGGESLADICVVIPIGREEHTEGKAHSSRTSRRADGLLP